MVRRDCCVEHAKREDGYLRRSLAVLPLEAVLDECLMTFDVAPPHVV